MIAVSSIQWNSDNGVDAAALSCCDDEAVVAYADPIPYLSRTVDSNEAVMITADIDGSAC